MIKVLDILRFIIGFIILGIGAYTDLKSRSASNRLWVVLGSFATIFLIFDFYLYGIDPFKIVFMIIMIILVYVLFQIHVIGGGADAKAIMSLSILIPYFVFDVLFLACIISLLSIPLIIIMKKSSVKEVMIGYNFPFLVSLFISFILSFILSGFWSISLFYHFVLLFS